MGQRMSDVPHIYGDDCLIGFPEDETPKYLYVRFSEIVNCPGGPPGGFPIPPNDRLFKLTQNPLQPCQWIYSSPEWYIQLLIAAGPLRIFLWLDALETGTRVFYTEEEGALDEGTVYNNEMTECIEFVSGIGGIAAVTWTQEATNLLKSLNIKRADDLFMEMRPLVDGNKVYKFCRLRDATNIAIEFEPD